MSFRAGKWIVGMAALGLLGGSDWRQYHGTDNTSVSPEKGLPASFADSDAGIAAGHVAWKAPLPGRGPSSPIVVAGRVIVTAASGPRQDRLHVLALDAKSGKLCWHRQLWATGSTVVNPFGGVAISTPASDGRLIFALFSSSDLACFDLEGNLQWHRGLGYENPTTRGDVGMASSPLVVGDTLVVQLENQGESFAMGVDAATGQTRWRLPREQEATWTSPLRLRGPTPETDVILLQSRSRLSVHDPRTGRELCDYKGDIHTVATATTLRDCIYLPSEGGLTALRWNPSVRSLATLWHSKRLQIGSASPIVEGGRLYALKSGGVLVCADPGDAHVFWQLRLKGPFWATPVLADGRLYAVNYEGLVQVAQLGAEGKLVATSQIDPAILASPAVAGGAIYFRSNSQLWKIAGPAAIRP
jgi:outer membrane protein assembly factor BamB